MPKGFVLTAQLSLLPPTNAQLNSILSTINSKLKGANVSINVKIPNNIQQQLNKLNGSFKNVKTSAANATSELENFGKQSALAIRRFAAFSAATGGFVALGVAIKHSFSEAIKFDREMVRIAQVTGKSLDGLKDLSGEITRLATGFGVSSAKIANVAVTLSQAGISAQDTKKALEVLAKTELSATFDDIKDTTEGAIAVMAQFGTSVNELERDLGAINTVSAKFAVESSDIITTVRRTGGAFKSAGGSLNELIALFTSVRSTTRESAESIATGFRTIFTRIQRPKTVQFLKDLGIELRDVKGQFVGPYEAVNRLSEALKNLPTTDPRFAKIIEELGGFRQVSKVIPLIQQFDLAQKALNTAQKSGNTITEDAATAQQALSVQLAKLREEFDALFRKIANNVGIRAFIDLSLKLASSLIRVADSLEPLLPLMLAFGSFKGAQAFGGIAKGFGPALIGKKKHDGGQIGFASGGLVPGQGNSDSVRANLTPGEFVLRKSAVKAIGVDNAAKLNKYADGGTVKFGIAGLLGQASESSYPIQVGKDTYNAQISAGVISKVNGARLEKETVRPAIYNAALESAKKLGATIGAQPKLSDTVKSMRKLDINSVSGQIFEAALGSLGAPYDDGSSIQDNLDFPRGIGKLSQLFGNDNLAHSPTDAKRRIDNAVIRHFKDTKAKKYIQALTAFGGEQGETLSMKDVKQKLVSAGLLSSKEAESFKSDSIINRFMSATKQLPFGFAQGKGNTFTRTGVSGNIGLKSPQKKLFASGGIANGTDTVPAMLTPGEYVINKESAKKLGLGTLNKINKFASGGAVGGIAGSIKENPIGAAFIGSQIASAIVGIGQFNGEIGKAVDAVSAITIRFLALNAGLKSSPIFESSLKNMSDEIKSTTRTLKDLKVAEQKNTSRRAAVDSGLNNLNTIQSRTGRLTPQQSKARGFLEGTKSLLEAEGASIFEQQEATRNRRRSVARGRKLQGALATGASIVGAVGGIAGGFVSDIGQQQLVSSGGTRGKQTFAGGGALSGAATGAAIGAVLAPITGGLSIAVGGLVGAVYGYTTSLKDADKQIRALQLEKDLSKIGDLGKQINSKSIGSTAGAAGVLDVLRSLDERRNQLKNTPGSEEELKNLKADIDTALPQVEQMLKTLAESSDTSAEFEKNLKLSAEYFDKHNGSGRAFEKTLIGGRINREKEKRIIAESNRLREIEDKKLQGIIKIGSAFGDLNSELDILTHSLDSTSTSFIDLSNIFSRLGENDNGRFNLVTNSVGDLLGPLGKGLAEQLTASNDLFKDLPVIINKAATASISSSDVDFKDAIDKGISPILGDGKIGKELRDKILNRVDTLIPSGEDTKAKEDAKADSVGFAKKLLEGATEEASKLFTTVLSTISKSNDKILTEFQNRANLEEKLTQGLQSIVDTREAKLNAIASFQERDVSAKEITGFDTERQNPLLRRAGVGSLNEAVGAIDNIQAQRSILTERLKQDGVIGTNDAKRLAELNNQFDTLTKTLEYFANATQRATALQSALNKETENRKKKQGVIEGISFGGPQERAENLKTLLSTAQAAKTGTLQGVNPTQAKKILDFLDSLGTAKVFGKGPANELRKQLTQSVTGKAFTEAGKEEKDIQKQILDIYNQGLTAQDALNKSAINSIKAQDRLIIAIEELTKATIAKATTGVAPAPERKRVVGAPIRRASGGFVPGSGNGDSVPAMLTPGEFVITKKAAQAIGYDNLHQLNGYAKGGKVRVDEFTTISGAVNSGTNNFELSPRGKAAQARVIAGENYRRSQTGKAYPFTEIPKTNFEQQYGVSPTSRKGRGIVARNARGRIQARQNKINANIAAKRKKFATGGEVTSSAGNINMDGFNSAITAFSNTASNLANSLNAFPRTIEMSARHTVEVIFNGAEIMTRLLPQIQEIAITESQNTLNNFIKAKMPDVGTI